MEKEKIILLKHAFCILLSFMMVISIVPQPAYYTFAANEQSMDAITITIQDELGQPIQGASVDFNIISKSKPKLNKQGKQISDRFGRVEILKKVDFIVNDFILDAVIYKDGFINKTIQAVALTSASQNINVILVSTTIDDVKIEGKTLIYNEKQQELLTISHLLETDIIEFGPLPDGVTLNDNQRPVAKNAGKYELMVTVRREGKKDLVLPITTVIQEGELSLTLKAKTLKYNGKEQALVSVEGLVLHDQILWTIDGKNVTENFIEINDLTNIMLPKAKAVKENSGYKVQLQVKRNNYKVFKKVVNVAINKGDLKLNGLKIEGLDSIYQVDLEGNAIAQASLKVTSEQECAYTLKYQLDQDRDGIINENNWQNEIPKLSNAGSYMVWVKAIQVGYNEVNVPIKPAAQAVAPYNVYIAKADLQLKFKKQPKEYTTITQTEMSNGKTFDFSVIANQHVIDANITYSIKIKGDDKNIATIDQSGILTIKDAGEIEIIAAFAGNDNYNACSIRHTLQVGVLTNRQGDLLQFKHSNMLYEIGDMQANLQNSAYKTYSNDVGSITYRIEKSKEYGLLIHADTIKIVDYAKLVHAVSRANGKLDITVRADKTAVEYANKKIKYAADCATYILTVQFITTPQNPYTLSQVDGTNGWYKSAVTVTPLAGYTIAKTAINDKGNNFSDTIQFNDQGTKPRFVYLKEIATGKITDKIVVNVKIDTQKPYALKVEYAKNPLDTFLEKITLGFYKPSLTLRFSAKDDISKLSSLYWTYQREQNQSQTNLDNDSGKIDFVDGQAEITLTANQQKQYRGHISFTAFDQAGNSTNATDHDNIFVIDTIRPTIKVQYAGKEPYVAAQNSVNKQHYFNEDVQVDFTITEANFNNKHVKVSIAKDGNKFISVNDVIWQDINEDIHRGTLMLKEDGDYLIKVEYCDASGNTMEPYQSETITVDKTAPILNVDYSKEAQKKGNKSYYNKDIMIAFVLKEANFRAEDVIVVITKDGKETKKVTPKWLNTCDDKHVGTYTLNEDGAYVINVEYKDQSNNPMISYTSHTIIIDTVKPVINVKYQNKNIINTLKNRKYFDDTQSAIITIKEHNFNEKDVNFIIVAKDVSGNKLDASLLHTKTKWSVGKEKDTHIITITYAKDANYTFDVNYQDLATNQANHYEPDHFTVDKTAPTALKISYSTSVLDTILESISFGFYNTKMTVTLSASDKTSGVHNFKYSYVSADGVSDVNTELINQAIQANNISYSKDGKQARISFKIPKDYLGPEHQFNGIVKFSTYDYANNESHKQDSKRIVVDNLAPRATVKFNKPVNDINNIAYYSGNINATIMITEANFYAEDVQIMINKDGVATKVVTNWQDVHKNLHIGKFTLQEEGTYTVTINYNDKSNNQMATYVSKKMIIDTKITKPTFTINGQTKAGFTGAYKGDVKIGFRFNDQNFANKTVTLTRTRYDKIEDVTINFINVLNNAKGGVGSFSIPNKVDNDGIYVLKITMSDHANHKSEAYLKFIINRYGSVYEYSDELVNLIKNGGQFVNRVDKDLVISEYNANQLLANSLQLLITRDGKAIDVDYTIKPSNINTQVEIDESGWNQYVYIINASNFKKDGVYKISLNSKYVTNDANKNVSSSIPDNSMNKKGNKIVDNMTFTVDSTLPEIRNIVNLNQAIADKAKIVNGKLNIKYTVVDAGGLKCIEIIVNGKIVKKLTAKAIGENLYNFTGSFDLKEQSGTKAHKVQIRVEDLAGNITDTNSKTFLNKHVEENKNHTYVFFNEVTVSRNFFVRWYANTMLFWSSMLVLIIIIGGICFLLLSKSKKENKNK